MIKPSAYLIRKGLRKNEEIKKLVDEIISIYTALEEDSHEYLNVAKFKYGLVFDISLSTLNKDWNELNVETLTRLNVNSTVCINGGYELRKNMKDIIFDIMANDVIAKLNYCIDSAYEVLKKVDFDKVYAHLGRCMAWSSNSVCLFYREQECGEHWIILPKEPNTSTRTYVNLISK